MSVTVPARALVVAPVAPLLRGSSRELGRITAASRELARPTATSREVTR